MIMLHEWNKEDGQDISDSMYATLTRIETENYGTDAWEPDDLISKIKTEITHIIVAFSFDHTSLSDTSPVKAHVAGYLLVEPNDNPGDYIFSMVVDHPFRRQGIARKLLDKLITLRGHEPITLMVRADNVAAIALYEQSGFVQFEWEKTAYKDGTDGWYMRRRTTAEIHYDFMCEMERNSAPGF